MRSVHGAVLHEITTATVATVMLKESYPELTGVSVTIQKSALGVMLDS
jgi:hypothetical protein